MQFFRNTSSIDFQRPVILHNNLMGVEVEKLKEILLEKDEGKGSLEVLTSDLLKETTFPSALLSP